MQAGNFRLRCTLGRGGISAFKREGDGATPLGAMRILSGFCKSRLKPPLRCAVALAISRRSGGWCDAPDDANYNRPVRLPYRASAEVMRRSDTLYDIGFVLDWNITSRRKNRGSAIFLHLSNPQGMPTQGCIALSRRDMLRLIPYLDRRTTIAVRR